jgi:hypothetical protein
MLAKSQMERRLRDRSKLSDLVELILSRSIVSTGMIQERLKVSKQRALNLGAVVLVVGLRNVQ